MMVQLRFLWACFVLLVLPGGLAVDEDVEENPFLDIAKNLVEGSIGQDGLSNLVRGLFDGGESGKMPVSGGEGGINPELMWKLGESLMGAWMGAGGHKHTDDPELEDEAAHEKHQAGTEMLFDWVKSLWTQIPKEWTKPIQDILDLFSGPQGIRPDDLFNSFENLSFRRRWIRSLSGFVAHWAKHLSDPDTQKMYLMTGSFAANQILQSQGWADRELLNPTRPFEESLSKVIDTILNKQFGLKVNSGTYVYPAVGYIKSIVKIGQGRVSKLSAKEIDDKLADTINSEVIESILRVWRAHKYSIQHPQCDKYLLCELNRPEHFERRNSSLKPGLTKAASLVSAWFLSGRTGTSFLDLYNASVEDYNCRRQYPVDCSGFHEEDIRITTEYAHTEL